VGKTKIISASDEFRRVFERANLELHPESPVPIYFQLSRLFIQLIQDEYFEAGSRFPSEESIADHYQVSRPTANKAVQILLDEGWLSRDKQHKRSGTYVKEKPYFDLGFLTSGMSFSDQFTEDVPIKSEIIWVDTAPATMRTAKKLHLQEGESITHLRRLRYAFEKPIMVCDSRILIWITWFKIACTKPWRSATTARLLDPSVTLPRLRR
jgi:DNA-binding GntR family transcriptional regulator